MEELQERLRAAAVSRLVSDVPLGVFLSGGVDSSTLVAIMSELTPGNISTFSVAFPEPGFNEESYASLVARRFQTRHHVVMADEPSLREALGILSNQLDEPIADPAVIPTFLVSRFARSQIKVALSGEGSDELFGGYPTYLGAQLAAYYLRLPSFLRRGLLERLGTLLPVSSSAVPAALFLRRFLENAEADPAHATPCGSVCSRLGNSIVSSCVMVRAARKPCSQRGVSSARSLASWKERAVIAPSRKCFTWTSVCISRTTCW